MKIVLFGATGRVGNEVLSLLLENKYEVTVLVRTPEKLKTHSQLTIIQGNACVRADVEKAISGADAVISALGTDQSTVLTESITHIIYVMTKLNIKRIVTIGTAGILISRENQNLLKYQSAESKRKSTVAAKEHHKVYDLLNTSGLDWTIVCPTYLPTGAETDAYIVERNLLPLGAVQSTTGDVALFAYNELVKKEHVGYRVGLMSPK
ncbi:NAD(P)H-binding protein [Psychrobacillus sp.]|uniref:NAD(P)-dependent oxidoreductase n=1 Tax=Psychrobacillus sp. TaxID=1871623 RepID=UPI0028BEE410|nr:NAD(P)H-binding protein [Psychrobacillus sp.]